MVRRDPLISRESDLALGRRALQGNPSGNAFQAPEEDDPSVSALYASNAIQRCYEVVRPEYTEDVIAER